MIVYHDEKYGFYEVFNERNGTLIRGNDSDGKDPAMRSYPELLDVGIMGYCDNTVWCHNARIDCYQKGDLKSHRHMSVEDFEMIARQSSGKTFQIALGGAGDPNKHPEFEEILKICRYYNIVPNITTSGKDLTNREIQIIYKYSGAVAVSWYSRLKDGKESNPDTVNAVSRLIDAGCRTNIHYVVSKDTIDEAIIRMKNGSGGFLTGINAVVYILYKPVGYGIYDRFLDSEDGSVSEFMKSVLLPHPYHIGFDTCFTSALVQYTDIIPKESIDACEAATFSMYIDSVLNCYPCSFGIWKNRIADSCRDKSIRDVWNGDVFENFRQVHNSCAECTSYELCRGGCRLDLGIELCDRRAKRRWGR